MPARKEKGSTTEKVQGRTLDTSAAEDVRTSGNNSVNVGDTNKRIWSSKEIGKLSSKDFAKYEEEIDEAYAEGRVTT
jgi:hypothetical protein